MNDFEAALVPGIRPRRTTIFKDDKGRLIFYFLWPWRPEPRLHIHGLILRYEVWKPPKKGYPMLPILLALTLSAVEPKVEVNVFSQPGVKTVKAKRMPLGAPYSAPAPVKVKQTTQITTTSYAQSYAFRKLFKGCGPIRRLLGQC